MSEPAGTEGPIEEFEIFRALDRYFEVRRREVEQSIERAGTEFKNFHDAQRQLMEEWVWIEFAVVNARALRRLTEKPTQNGFPL